MRLSTFLLGGAALQLTAAYDLVMYWGQNDSERSLAEYCTGTDGVNIMVLSFLNRFGNGVFPHGNIGTKCRIYKDGSSSGCGELENDISACRNAGVKVFMSVGGADIYDSDIGSAADARGIAYSLWNSFARPSATSNSPRPLGNAYVDGWDFDLEANPNGHVKRYLGDLVTALRGHFSSDSGKTYYISGAPECPTSSNLESPMAPSIMSAKYDYLWIQFYNNNCAAADVFKNSQNNPNGAGDFNLADWPGYLSNGASSNAKLLVGIPGSKAAATTYDYVPTIHIKEVLGNSEGVRNFDGFMVYDAGASDVPDVNHCTYAKNVRRTLDTGDRCQ